MEELEQKHLHLLQVVESEKTAKWQYTQHCEELTEEIKKLRTEVSYAIFLKKTEIFYRYLKFWGTCNSYFSLFFLLHSHIFFENHHDFQSAAEIMPFSDRVD